MTLYEFYMSAYTFYKETGCILGFAMIQTLHKYKPELLDLCKVNGHYPLYSQSIHDEELKKFFQFIEKNWHSGSPVAQPEKTAVTLAAAVKVISPLLWEIAEFFHEKPENLSIDPIDGDMICVSCKTLPAHMKNYTSEDFALFCKKHNFSGLVWFNEDNTITFSIQLGQVG